MAVEILQQPRILLKRKYEKNGKIKKQDIMDEDIYEVYGKMIAGQLLTKTYPKFIYMYFVYLL